MYNADSPLHMTLYPALSRMIYRGDVEEGDVVSRRTVHLPSLAKGRLGFDQDVQQEHDYKSFGATVHKEAFAVGRVAVEFTEEFQPTKAPDLSEHVDPTEKVVRSETDQLIWHRGAQDFYTVDTPGTKAVVGFSGDQTHTLGDLSLRVETEFAVVFVTSLDGMAPVSEADHILVTTVARARNTDMRYSEDGSRLLAPGRTQVRMEPVTASLSIERPDNPTVHVLDHNGRRTGRTIPVNGTRISLDGAEHETLYYELVY